MTELQYDGMNEETAMDEANSARGDTTALPGRTLWEKFREALCYLRGYLTSFRFDRRALISSSGRTKIIKTNGTITIGNRTKLWPNVKLVSIGPDKRNKAKLTIGHHSSLGDGVQIHCGSRVHIGNYTLISWEVNVLGMDYHAPGGDVPRPSDIVIEDHVWIGCKSIIIKGITIGRGAVIGAGAVVTKNVPPYSLVAGNPAKIIKQTESWNGR